MKYLHTMVRVSDLDASLRFYRDALGLEELSRAAKRSVVKKIKRAKLKRATEKLETLKAKVRARVEHPFRVVKRQFGFMKVRFKGLAKNTAQVITLFALSNLWMARKQLLAMTGPLRPQFGNCG